MKPIFLGLAVGLICGSIAQGLKMDTYNKWALFFGVITIVIMVVYFK